WPAPSRWCRRARATRTSRRRLSRRRRRRRAGTSSLGPSSAAPLQFGLLGGHVRVAQVEGGTFRPDARQGREVVPRRRAGGRPLERVAVPPRVVDGDLGRLLVG